MKKCYKCRKNKSLDEFHHKRSSKDGHTDICKECKSDYMKVRHKKNAPRLREQKRDYRKRNFIEITKRDLVYKKEQRQQIKVEIFNVAGNKCAKCGFSDWRAFHIDHVKGGGRADRKGIHPFKYLRQVLESLKKGEGKYQILCANCNSIKMYEQNEHGKKK